MLLCIARWLIQSSRAGIYINKPYILIDFLFVYCVQWLSRQTSLHNHFHSDLQRFTLISNRVTCLVNSANFAINRVKLSQYRMYGCLHLSELIYSHQFSNMRESDALFLGFIVSGELVFICHDKTYANRQVIVFVCVRLRICVSQFFSDSSGITQKLIWDSDMAFLQLCEKMAYLKDPKKFLDPPQGLICIHSQAAVRFSTLASTQVALNACTTSPTAITLKNRTKTPI